MRHARPLDLEALEPRKLLTRAHVAAHIAPAVVAVPLVLNGTLNVDNNAASANQNDDGSMTTSIPVAGVLGTLGKVRGLWNESVDQFGDYEGPDTIQLRDSKGTFVIAFNNANPGKAHRIKPGLVYYELPQKLYNGTGAYAKASESGSIELNTSTTQQVVESLTLITPSS